MENYKYLLINKLYEAKQKVFETMTDYANNFVHYIDGSTGYFTDLISEFADQNTSIYYADQKKFYFEHTEQCEEAFSEYGYTGSNLKDLLDEVGTLENLICKCGAVGEYAHIESEVYESQDEIITILAIREAFKQLDEMEEAETIAQRVIKKIGFDDFLNTITREVENCEMLGQIEDAIKSCFETIAESEED